MHPYLQPLITTLEAAADPALATPMSKYMKNRFEFYGIKTPQRRDIFKTFIKTHGLPPMDELEDIVEELWGQPYRECHYCAVELLRKCEKQLKPVHLPLIEEMITTNSWWDTVDTIAAHLGGPLFKKHPELIPLHADRWINSDNFWLQRTAILYQLAYKRDTDAERLFSYCKQRASSKEFFIRKGIGWALRQYAYTNPQAVKQFVVETPLHSLSQREALKNLHPIKINTLGIQ